MTHHMENPGAGDAGASEANVLGSTNTSNNSQQSSASQEFPDIPTFLKREAAPGLRRKQARAADATVEAIMYSLRSRGTAALTEADTQSRLAALDEAQLHTVAARLQALRTQIARPWTPENVEALVFAWVNFHEDEFLNG
jgi:hypothetical protein